MPDFELRRFWNVENRRKEMPFSTVRGHGFLFQILLTGLSADCQQNMLIFIIDLISLVMRLWLKKCV